MDESRLLDSNFRKQVAEEVLPLIRSIRDLEKRLKEAELVYTDDYGFVLTDEQQRICFALRSKWFSVIGVLSKYGADERAISEFGFIEVYNKLGEVVESPRKDFGVKLRIKHNAKSLAQKYEKMKEYRDDLSITCIGNLTSKLGIELDEVEGKIEPDKELENQAKNLYAEDSIKVAQKDALGLSSSINYRQENEGPVSKMYALEFLRDLQPLLDDKRPVFLGSDIKGIFDTHYDKVYASDLKNDVRSFLERLNEEVQTMPSEQQIYKTDSMIPRLKILIKKLEAYTKEN